MNEAVSIGDCSICGRPMYDFAEAVQLIPAVRADDDSARCNELARRILAGTSGLVEEEEGTPPTATDGDGAPTAGSDGGLLARSIAAIKDTVWREVVRAWVRHGIAWIKDDGPAAYERLKERLLKVYEWLKEQLLEVAAGGG